MFDVHILKYYRIYRAHLGENAYKEWKWHRKGSNHLTTS